MKNTFSVLFSGILLLFTVSAMAQNKVVVVPLGSSVKISQKTFTLSLPSASFIPGQFAAGDPQIYFNSGEFAFLMGSDVINGLAAPINLQDGAIITGATCYMYDNSTSNFTAPNTKFKLWRRATSLADSEQITPWSDCSTTSASTTIHDCSASSITYPIIDNSQYFYGAYVLLSISAEDPSVNQLRFYGCKITYTLDVVVP